MAVLGVNITEISRGPMMLGKSFLERLKYWKINNINQTLELEK